MVDNYTENFPSVVTEETEFSEDFLSEEKKLDYSPPRPLDEKKPALVSNEPLPLCDILSGRELKLVVENNFLKQQLARVQNELVKRTARGMRNKNKFEVSRVIEEPLRDDPPGKENSHIRRLLGCQSTSSRSYHTIY